MTFAAALIVGLSLAAEAQAPPYNNLRFEEDWTSLTSAEAGDWWDPAKNIDLGHGAKLSLGGSARVRYEAWRNFGFGELNDDEFTLYRLYLHSDWRFGEHWRVFVESRASTVNNRDLPGGKRAGLDIDEYDLWNAFVEYRFALRNLDLTARLGRQELQFGAQRLISPLDWSNNRRIFDGAVLRLKSPSGWRLDAFMTAPVGIDPDEFSWNDTDHTRLFSGLYYQRPLMEGRYNAEAYFLALNHIDDLPIEEDRYTVGGRFYGTLVGNWTFDTELALQFGDRDYRAGQTLPSGRLRKDEDILAWMLTAEATYTFADLAWRPWITLGLDLASGDDDAKDADNNTFDQLFPLAHAFLGYADVLGRQNVVDVRASLGTWPIPSKLKLQADLHYLRLEDEGDGIYAASGALGRGHNITTPGGRVVGAREREIGTELDLTALYKFDRHSDLLLGYSRFFADGAFLEKTGTHEDIDFLYAQVSYKF